MYDNASMSDAAQARDGRPPSCPVLPHSLLQSAVERSGSLNAALEEWMKLSFKRSALLLLIAATTSGAFLMGQKLGAGAGETPRVSSLLLSADAAHGGTYGASGLNLAMQDANIPPDEVFESVLDHVHRDYVRSYGGDSRLAGGALTEMYASLNDPRTDYLNPSMRKARQEALMGRYHGIGAVLAITQAKRDDVDYRYLTVVDVMPGSPAEKAGLMSGDHITELDGHWIIAYSFTADLDRIRREAKDDASKQAELDPITARFKSGYPLSKALEKLTDGDGKSYKITITRGDKSPLHVALTTGLTQVLPVEYRELEAGIGYLRVRQFNAEATRAFGVALKGAGNLKGLILDLRGNPGGVTAETETGIDGYSSAKDLIASLTPGGKAAVIERRLNQKDSLMIRGMSRLNGPLSVIMDAGTANLSELVAAALHDIGKARLVGRPTFGDDILQLFAPLKDGSAVEITTAHLFTAGGVDLNRGIQPDIVLSPAEIDTDAALKYALSAVRAGA